MSKSEIRLSDHFTYGRLIRFTFPSVIMVIFTSIYSVADGLFVSNFAGATPFAAVNIVWPLIQILGAVGFMLGSGGSALVAKTLGEQREIKANRIFSMLIYATIIFGIVAAVCGTLFVKPLVTAFGVKGDLLKDCLTYGYILLPAVPALMLQSVFQLFMVTAERPKFGLAITVIAGVSNIVLDALFIIVFGLGLAGAAYATVISQIIGAAVPLIYFAFPNKSPLRLGKTGLYTSALVKACTNGASEFMSNISMSLVSTLYNWQLLRLIGQDGVVAYGIISYVNFIFVAAFLGYGMGSEPVVSYHFGAQNRTELKSLFHKSLRLIAAGGVFFTLLAEVSAGGIAGIFVGYDADLTDLAAYGFRVYSVSFLLAGFNIYASAFFTALNNGLVSAVIACCRTLVFECLSVLLLPLVFGVNGIWCAIIVAETAALAVSCICLKKYRTKYGY